jgi:hypothetical protein
MMDTRLTCSGPVTIVLTPVKIVLSEAAMPWQKPLDLGRMTCRA